MRGIKHFGATQANATTALNKPFRIPRYWRIWTSAAALGAALIYLAEHLGTSTEAWLASLGVLVVVIALGVLLAGKIIERREWAREHSSINENPVPAVRSLSNAIVLAMILILVDAFILNQGLVAFIVGVFQAFALLATALPRYASMRLRRLRNIGIYSLAVAIVFALNALNNTIAQRRGAALVTAISEFHLKEGRYPRSLDELVPKYVTHVPVAKYTLAFSEFGYNVSKDDATLYFVSLPPFGRPTYSFVASKWRFID